MRSLSSIKPVCPVTSCYWIILIVLNLSSNGKLLDKICQISKIWHICLLLFISINIGIAQNPHGDNLKLDCAACHTSDGWEIPFERWNFEENPKIEIAQNTGQILTDTSMFNHFNTAFPLNGEHANVDCRACHESLIFDQASMDCISCHTDIHRQTVGSDCVRCHFEENWLVDNITELHQENGFPLLGVHAQINCNECHISETGLEFPRIGNECVNCHLADFNFRIFFKIPTFKGYLPTIGSVAGGTI